MDKRYRQIARMCCPNCGCVFQAMLGAHCNACIKFGWLVLLVRKEDATVLVESGRTSYDGRIANKPRSS